MPRPVGDDDSLKGLLRSDRIEVPEYQRTYDWDKNKVEQLLVCLSEQQQLYPGALQQNPYFLGNLMIHTEIANRQSKYWLVDGQQRLVTLTILAAVIRDLLIENELYKLAFELQDEIIGDNAAENPKVKPRETMKESSPRQLLWPIQAPPDQEVTFQFANDYNTNMVRHKFDLAAPMTAQFPLPQGTKFEINIGTKFELLTSIEAGEIVPDLFGDLTLDPGVTVSTGDDLKFKSTWRSEVHNHMRHTWKETYLIPRHFKKVIRNFLDAEITAPGGPTNIEKYLRDWKDIVTFMSFTTTTFDDDADAIYYFGKLNDSETSQQLNVGDLMRHHVALVTAKPPLQHPKDPVIVSSWGDVELLLKADKPKDMVPTFLTAFLTAHANRKTTRKAYTTLKKESTDKFETAGAWDKDKFSGWINRIREASEQFRPVVFPEMGDPYHLRMKCIGGLASQHRALFLCGLLALEKFNLKNEMSRLINIFEFMTVKGVEFPTLIGTNGITSQARYSLIDKYCEKLHSKSNGFTTKMRTAEARKILDKFAAEVKSECTSIWDGAKADTTLPQVTGWDAKSLRDLEPKQSFARLLLSRIEMNQSGTKTWSDDVEVEHILPQTWQAEWADTTKGGGFSGQVQANEYLNKLGNKTLLDPGSNKTLSNSNFSDKQSHTPAGYDLQARNWAVTKDITSTKVAEWNPAEIEKRSTKLFKQLIKIYDGNFMN